MLVAYLLGGFEGADVPGLVLSFNATPRNGYVPLILVPLCCVCAYWLRMVKLSGALAGTVVSMAVAHGAGWPGLAMLAALLGFGHAATVRSRRNRGAGQVLCNGAVAGLAALFAGPLGFVAMAGALATSLSDTAGGEVGQRFGGTPRILLIGPKVRRGTDGGMSVIGTSAGLIMALMVPLAGWAADGPFDLFVILVVAGGGFAGNLADSLLGATLQPYLGNRGNDYTNFLATLCGAVAAVLLLYGFEPGEVLAAPR